MVSAFKHATRGIVVAIQSERNMRIHLMVGGVVILVSAFLEIETTDLVILLILIALVIATEMVNTAIEKICNILRDTYKLPYTGSRDIRDIASGAVWVVAITAAIGGLLILGKYL